MIQNNFHVNRSLLTIRITFKSHTFGSIITNPSFRLIWEGRYVYNPTPPSSEKQYNPLDSLYFKRYNNGHCHCISFTTLTV